MRTLIILLIILVSGCATTSTQYNYDKVIAHANAYFVACIGEPESEACSADNYAMVETIKQQAIIDRATKQAILYQQEKHRRILINRDINESQGITIDAYGPGIHMDQYGRPVTITPRY